MMQFPEANKASRMSAIPTDVLYADSSRAPKANHETRFYRNIGQEKTPCETCTKAESGCGGFYPAVALRITWEVEHFGNTYLKDHVSHIRTDKGMDYLSKEAHRIISQKQHGKRVVGIQIIPDQLAVSDCARFDRYLNTAYGRYAA